MHFHTIVAFALLFWQAEAPLHEFLIPASATYATLAFVWGQAIVWALLAAWSARKSNGLLQKLPSDPERASVFHHRAMAGLRIALVIGFGASVMLTGWPEWFAIGRVTPTLQIFGDLIVLSPYFIGCVTLWLVAFPVERRLHGFCGDAEASPPTGDDVSWQLSSYLDFHLRHHLLIVAGPMILILFASNLTRGYENELRNGTGWFWTPDALLAASAALVFLISPFLLKKVWRTTPLAAGPLRERLENLCGRIGLRCREILVWQSDGMMINAAVMGIMPPARYVLLSDALLANMTPRQIEAVFGHEAGHVRHRHIQHFLLFAFIGWLIAGGVVELLALCYAPGEGGGPIALALLQGAGLCATFVFWLIGFGWLSRRFERQADLFGARCVTPEASECRVPCSVHGVGAGAGEQPERICSTAASVFAAALDRVALLGGIPHEERSWRHSSVGSRIRFLQALAGDPARAVRFERAVRRAQALLVAAAVTAGAGAVAYWMLVPQPALMRMTIGESEAQQPAIAALGREGEDHAIATRRH